MVTGVEKIKSLLMTHGVRWLEYALVLLAAWMVSGSLVAGSSKQRGGQSVLLPTAKAAVQEVDVAFLQGVHLFGFVDAQAKPDEVPTTPLLPQPSQLAIQLVGTVVAGSRSAAVLTMNGSKEQLVFFVRDDVQPGVTLVAVETMAIVLDNRGQQERIDIEEGATSLLPMPSRALPKTQFRRMNRKVERRIDRHHMQTELRDFSKLLSQARVTPHFTNKKADGFTISEIVKGSLYEQIGLINGDIIRKVNGESVVSAEQAMRMYKELQNATNIDVEIERNGSIQQVSYSIQ